MNLEQLARALQSLDTQAAATVQKAVDEIAGLHTRVAELEAALRIAALRFDYLNAGGIEELNGVSTVAGAEECRAAIAKVEGE